MLVLGSDHGGFLLKQEIKKHLEERGIAFSDVGCFDENSVDYPDVAKAACDKIVSGECELGILICGTGIGISMAANKVKVFVLPAAPTASAQNSPVYTTMQTFCASADVLSAQVLPA